MTMLIHRPELLEDPKVDKLRLDNEYGDLLQAMRLLYFKETMPTPEALALSGVLSDEVVAMAAGLSARGVPNVAFEKLRDKVVEETQFNNMAKLLNKYHSLALGGEATYVDLVSQFASEVMDLASGESARDMTLGADFTEFDSELRWRQENPGKLLGYSTGFSRVDRHIDGLVPKRYHVFAARPSVGKSAILCNMTESLCDQGLGVAWWSYEMPKAKLQSRVVSGRARVPLGYSEIPLSGEEMKRISKATREMKKWNWFINDNQDTTIDQLETQATALWRQKLLHVICVDYLQMVKIISKVDRWEQVGIISNRLRNLGKRLNVPVVVLAQLKRSTGRYVAAQERTVYPPPEISDLRESGNIEQDADVIGLLERDVKGSDEEKRKAKLDLAKVRDGATTSRPINLDYTPELTLFREAA